MKRHTAVYEPCEPSPSGKLQWRCTVCNRITTGAERECYTIQNWVDEQHALGLLVNAQAFLNGTRRTAEEFEAFMNAEGK